MLTNILKKIFAYNFIVKLKPFWVSHIAVAGFYICEICALILTISETLFEQIDLSNGITLDYVLGLKIYFVLNHIIFYTLLGFCEIILLAILILLLIIKFLFKKNLILKIKTGFLLNNNTYHYIWVLGFYFVLVISFCTLIYLFTLVDYYC